MLSYFSQRREKILVELYRDISLPRQTHNAGFTLFELLISIVIISIISGGIVSFMSDFNQRQQLDISAMKLLKDLRQTQQFARTQRDGWKYYGIRFFNNLGKDADRAGYRIIRFEPIDVVVPVNPNNFTVIKSSEMSDNDGKGPEILEDTFFAKNVFFDETSPFRPGVDLSVVFTPRGSITKNGLEQFEEGYDRIVLELRGNHRTIRIISQLTGYFKIE